MLLATGVTNVFVFEGIAQKPVPSLLREFSAPVILDYAYSDADLSFLLAHDDDAFNRWEAGQRLFMSLLKDLALKSAAGADLTVPAGVIRAFRTVLTDTQLDAAIKAEALALPSEITIAEQMDEVDPGVIHTARVFLRRALAQSCRRELLAAWQANTVTGPYRPDPAPAGKRALQGLAMVLLLELDDAELAQQAAAQCASAANMTDQMNALGALMLSKSPQRDTALAQFFDRFKDDALVVDKWLALQAGARGASTLTQVERLMQHSAFSIKNPNKVRSLIGTFCHGNPAGFHAADGSGYAFWAEQVAALDAINPQVAARLARAAARPGLSKDTYEVVSKSLA